MTSNEIRTRFLEFFATRGHRVVPSSSLVPANDPTLLFSNAGMNQFKDVFLGRERRDYSRATTSQKCVRAGGKHNDLEQVGRTTRHHTFFEMLGNFSFGDYFKKQAIPWAWELITKDFAIPAEKLYVTVFREDDDAEEIWAQDVGVPRDRIFRMDEKDNFWQMGDTGPCGPCSEIHYDMGIAASDQGHTDCKFPCDCGRYVELWNLVFMQFNRDEQGTMTPLPKPSIDTGAGLERLASVLQGKLSNFETDLFRPLIDEAAALANVEYGANHDTDVSLRIIADHARSATFLISDGVLPSNEGRGYVLRLITRRALYHGQTLGLNEPFLYKIGSRVVDMMKDAYPELVQTAPHVAKAIKIEEEQFARTTRVGLERLETVDVILPSGDPVQFHLAKALRRVISHRQPNESLVIAYNHRREGANIEPWERTAYEEWERTQPRLEERLRKFGRQVVDGLSPQAREQDWVGDFRRIVDEVSNAYPRTYRAGLEEIRRRVQGNSLLTGPLDRELNRLPPEGVAGWIPREEVFKLHDTFGLRPEFIEDIVGMHGFSVDRDGYEAEMQNQRERARESWKGRAQELSVRADVFVLISNFQQLAERNPTKFEGYEQTISGGCRVLALFENGKSIAQVQPGSKVEIILDHTPFYAESGGQVGDTGHLVASGTDHEVGQVLNTYRPVSGLIVHMAVMREGLQVGDVVTAVVDVERRDATRRNHTATHLLHAALRKTLGTHVKQAGSLVAPDRLRFDFTHYTGVGEQDLLDIEDLVNDRILKNEEVVTTVMDLDSAVSTGAMALFGEKYADHVRVLTIDDFSKELCGGTHVRRTGDIGLFKVVSEGSVAAGTRRIEAVTGTGVLDQLRRQSQSLAQASEALRAKPEALIEAIENLTESEKKLRKELEAQRMKRAVSAAGDLVQQAREIKGVRVLAARVEVTDRSAMRQMVDDLRGKLQSGVIVLGSVADGRVSLIAAVTKDLTAKLDAGKIVKQAATYVEGSGGGRKDLAEAGGKNPAKLDESIQAVPGIIEQML